MRIRSTGSVRSIPGSTKVIVKSSAQSMRQMRCPRCHGICTPTMAADGRLVTACPNGHQFGSNPI